MSTTTITDTGIDTTEVTNTAATGTTATDTTASDATATGTTASDTATDFNTTAVLPDSAPSDGVPGTSGSPAAPVTPDAQSYSYPAPASGERYSGISIASFVIGLVSIVSSWTFLAPLTGLILGIVALRRQTSERTLAIWGVALNGALLAITVLILIVVLLFVGAVGFAGIAGVLAA